MNELIGVDPYVEVNMTIWVVNCDFICVDPYVEVNMSIWVVNCDYHIYMSCGSWLPYIILWV